MLLCGWASLGCIACLRFRCKSTSYKTRKSPRLGPLLLGAITTIKEDRWLPSATKQTSQLNQAAGQAVMGGGQWCRARERLLSLDQVPDAFTSDIHPTGHKCFVFSWSFVWAPRNMWRVATAFKILHLDSAVSTSSCKTLYEVHFSAGLKCYCYLQSNQTAEGFYKQQRTKIYLPWSVYGFSRKRQAVCRGQLRFSGGNQCPPLSWTGHFVVFQGGGCIIALNLQVLSYSIIWDCPGPLHGPEKWSCTRAAPLDSADKLWGPGVSALPRLPLQPPPGSTGFYWDVESIFSNSRHSNNLDFSFCTFRL